MGQDTIVVEIGGRPYHLKAGDNPDYVRQVADYVNEKMVSLSDMAPSLQPTHLAVLTAINIADELLRNREGDPEAENQACERIQAMIDLIPGE